MSNRTSLAQKAIRDAWKREQSLVQNGKGTRDWTAEQQKDIIDIGIAYDENGVAFQGQHMKSVEQYPEFQSDSNNIQFLTRDEHLEAHGGNWQNPTNGYYDYRTKKMIAFGDALPPCPIIKLSNPIYAKLHTPPNNVNNTTCTVKNSRNHINLKHRLNLIKKGFIGKLKFVGNWVKQHPIQTVEIVLMSSAIVTQGINLRKSFKTSKTSINNVIPDIGNNNIITLEKTPRKSPDKHQVGGHFRSNGTYVNSYTRGGKNKSTD